MNAKLQKLIKRRTIIRVTILTFVICSIAGLPAWTSFARRAFIATNPNQSTTSVPVASADSISTAEDTGLTFRSRSLSQNDNDANTDSLIVTDVTATSNTHGSVSFVRTPSFRYRSLIPTGRSAWAVASRDLNGDGKSDLVVTDPINNYVSVLIATEGGAFGSPTNIPLRVGPEAIAIEDLNGDGHLDLAIGYWSHTSLSIVPGTGAGSFGTPTHYTTNTIAISISTGDFNNDGSKDLVIANGGVGRVTILLNTGGGVFGTPRDISTGGSPVTMAVADFDQNGSQDVAIGNASGTNLSILPGDGSGNFGPVQLVTVGAGTHSVATSDFNADNLPDLAVGNGGSNTVSILLATGNGAFDVTNLPSGGMQPSGIAISDLNQDGHKDLFVSHFYTGALLMLGTGTGAFSMSEPLGSGGASDSQTIAIGDFSGDGYADYAVAGKDRGEIGGKVEIMLSTGGMVSFGTADLLLNAGGSAYFSSVAAADLNHDGNQDLVVIGYSLGVFVLIGNGTGSFTHGNPIPAGESLRSVAVSDFNNDGHPDIVAANEFANNVVILLGTGTGSFQPATYFPAGTRAFSVAVGDFNGDSAKDLAVASANSGSVSILMGTGTGSFGPPSNIGLGGAPWDLAVGDLDADGDQDLAVAAQQGGGALRILLGTGTGSFAAPTTISNFPTGSVAIEDMNGDGIADLLSGRDAFEHVSVFLGQGGGSFAAPTDFFVGRQAKSLATGDFNSDGHADVAVESSVLLGDGSGALGAPVNYLSNGFPTDVVIAEVTGDGRPDLIVANSEGSVAVLRGRGDGSVEGATRLGTGNPMCVTASDLNLDGIADLAVCSGSLTANVTIFLGRGNGTFDTGGQVTTAFGTVRMIEVGDLNRDGKPDLVTLSPDTDRVGINLGTGTGAFLAPTELVIGDFPRALAIADVNLDGNLDVAVGNGLSNDVSILMGNGTGSLTPAPSVSAGLGPNSIALRDLNSDGNIDMVIVNREGNDVHVRMGIGGGSFAAASVYPTGGRPSVVSVADYNSDGNLDLVVGKDDGSQTSCILIGTGGGMFQPAANFWIDGGIAALGSADFDGDGKLDLATNSHMLLGNGNGSFGAGTYNTDFGDSMAVSDFNRDGRPDLVVANYSGHRLTVTLNSTSKSVSYAPDRNFNGTASFNYTVRNRNGASAVGTVTVAVAPINDSPAARTRNVTVSANAQCKATASIDNGSFDVDSAQITLTQTPAAPYSLGTTTVTLTATDSEGASSQSRAIVTVVDDTPPVLTAPDDLTVTTTAASSCGVNIDWLGSYFANDPCQGVVPVTVSGVPAGNLFPVGTTTVTYTTTDARGNTAVKTQRVTVIDGTPPVIETVSVDKPAIWPAKNQMVDVLVDYTATDCDATVTCTLSVSSNDATGGAGDWEIIDAHHIKLRAEKGEGKNPRIYTITVTCVDSRGNSSSKATTVSVSNR